MIKVLRTDSQHSDFVSLVAELDAFLAELDGEEHAFYNSLNKIDRIKNVIVVYEDDKPIACGAIREFSPSAMEVKRMYTVPGYRGKGIATKVLNELEKWAVELNYEKCVLETGIRQPDAIHLYTREGYKRIPNYGKYINVENSVCFEKELKSKIISSH
jgi:GNAT superfamily N-acetyltransferase